MKQKPKNRSASSGRPNPKGLTRRKFLKRGTGLATGALVGLYVKPSFKSIGASPAYAAITGTPPTDPPACVVTTVNFDAFPTAARMHTEEILDTSADPHATALAADWCISRITVFDKSARDGDDNLVGPSTWPNGAMIFDSASPTGGDEDLRTPGGAGGHPTNIAAQRKILIIQENAPTGSDPWEPDDRAAGGKLVFCFTSPLEIVEVQILDIDEGENSGECYVRTYDSSETEIGSKVGMLGLGNNSFQRVTVGRTGVKYLVVRFSSSGAVAKLVLCK